MTIFQLLVFDPRKLGEYINTALETKLMRQKISNRSIVTATTKQL